MLPPLGKVPISPANPITEDPSVNTPQERSSALLRAIDAVDTSKSRLLDLIRDLEAAGCKREAASLLKIAERLEGWQCKAARGVK
jgi:hypothetical protein